MLQEIKRFSYLNLEENARAYTILRYLFLHDGSSYDSIAEKLYCSKSTILRELPKMQSILSAYELELQNRRNSGLFILGNEWNKRLCLLFLEKAYRSLSEEEKDQEPDFSNAICRNQPLGTAVRKKVYDRLNLSAGLHIPPIDQPKVHNYIFIAKARSSQRKNMIFTDEQIAMAKDDIVYPFAKSLCQSLSPSISQDFDETEYVALSMLLQAYRSIANESEIPAEEFQNDYIEAEEIIDFISHRYGIAYRLDDKCRKDLAFYLYKIRRLLTFHIIPDEEIMEPSHETGLLSTDLCVEFGKYFSLKHHINLPEEIIMPAYYIFNRSLTDHYIYPLRARILISSIYGLRYGECIAAELRKHYANYIEKIDVTTVTHAYAINERLYDVILSDSNPDHFQNMKIPMIPISFFRDAANEQAIARYLEMAQMKRSLLYFPKEHMKSTDCAERSDIYSYIVDCLKDEIVNSADFLKDLSNREYYASSDRHNGIVLLTTFSYTFSKPCIYLFVNKEPILWNSKPGRFFVFYQYGVGRQNEIYFVLHILKKIIHMDPDVFSQAAVSGYDSLIQAMLSN